MNRAVALFREGVLDRVEHQFLRDQGDDRMLVLCHLQPRLGLDHDTNMAVADALPLSCHAAKQVGRIALRAFARQAVQPAERFDQLADPAQRLARLGCLGVLQAAPDKARQDLKRVAMPVLRFVEQQQLLLVFPVTRADRGIGLQGDFSKMLTVVRDYARSETAKRRTGKQEMTRHRVRSSYPGMS